ncbi:MAG TPA: septum formation initiator family protein [Candidatus Binataceae bacterium]|nr:septum formation initiator family protein [Candidatus Binataceae bacterium]
MLSTVLVALLANALLAAMGPRDLVMLRERRSELEQTRADLMLQKSELETSVQNLRSNDRFIEHLIRRELGYARTDEVVYKFTGPAASDPRKEPAAETSQTRARRSVLAGLTLQLLSEVGLANK